jgi:hypothetical protein
LLFGQEQYSNCWSLLGMGRTTKIYHWDKAMYIKTESIYCNINDLVRRLANLWISINIFQFC